MAHPRHVEVAEFGAEALNDWRKRHPNDRIDLSGADLRDSDLVGARLAGADLSGANFARADLRKANLSEAEVDGADFHEADLGGTNLSDASLIATNFVVANLREANLGGARLEMANLSGAILSRTNLSWATCHRTIFAAVDLSETIGLDSVKHLGPSTIGIDTLYKSDGKIPEEFLRGCGVPDNLNAYLPSLIGGTVAIQFYSCFISYSSKDGEFCKRLHARLQEDHLRVWFAPEEMKAGLKIHEQIDDAIRLHDKLLLVVSEHSMNSEWVITEIRKARKREKREGKRVLFPIRLVPFERLQDWEAFDADTGNDMAVEVREYYVPDFSGWKDHDTFEGEYKKLLRDLQASAEPNK